MAIVLAQIKAPVDLYIPPDALQVMLETFEGPLDLLWYLIKKNNQDVLDISVSLITHQYMDYIKHMQSLRLELAAEYLVMAAMLAEIKSHLLLPRPPPLADEEGEDPRAELVRKLLEYERYKKAALKLDELPREGRDFFKISPKATQLSEAEWEQLLISNVCLPDVSLASVISAMFDVNSRLNMRRHHKVAREALTVADRMSDICRHFEHIPKGRVPFYVFFTQKEGRLGAVVTVMAVLELVKQAALIVYQEEPFEPLLVERRN